MMDDSNKVKVRKSRGSYAAHIMRKAVEIRAALRKVERPREEEIDAMVNDYQDIFDKFEECHMEYQRYLDDVEAEEDQAYFEVRQEQYEMIMEKVGEWKSKFCEPSTVRGEVSRAEFLDSMKLMANTIAEGFALPKTELSTFDGNPTKYLNFMMEFETNVEKYTQDESKRLSILLSFCRGEARNAIECCKFVSDGLDQAKRILRERFGQPYVIANAYIKEITEGPILRVQDKDKLISLASKMENCKLLMSEMGQLSELNACHNIHKIVLRLPNQIKGSWLEHVGSLRDSGTDIKFSHLTDFLKRKVRYMNDPIFGDIFDKEKSKPNTGQIHTHKKSGATTLLTLKSTSKPTVRENSKCANCSSNAHYIQNCADFLKKDAPERFKIVKNTGICINCFIPGHRSAECRKHSMCNENHCQMKHHRLLHDAFVRSNAENEFRFEVNQNVDTNQKPSNSDISEVNVSSKPNLTTSYFPVIAVKVVSNNSGKEILTNALLDSASDINLCSEELMTELGSDFQNEDLIIRTVGRIEEHNAKRGSFQIKSLDDDTVIQLSEVWSVKSLKICQSHIPLKDELNQLQHMRDIEYSALPNSKIHLLIGSCTPQAFISTEHRIGCIDDPIAVKGPLGWAVLGPKARKSANQHYVNLTQYCKGKLDKEIKRLWDIESLGLKYHNEIDLSQDDRKMLKCLNDTVKLTDDSHYEVGLPWRDDVPMLPNNKQVANKRLISLKHRLEKDDDYFEKYSATINDYLENGYARKVPTISNDSQDQASPTWYIPHHGVIQPKKNNVRVVFDCSAICDGVSINSKLLSGPDLTNKLVKVLLNFRLEPIAILADIQAMFHQVRVTPKDTNSLRFLWWKNSNLNGSVEEYQMTVHVFGLTSSPSCANFVLKKTADDNVDRFSKVAIIAVHENFYVDDFIKSVKTSDQAIDLVTEISSILSLGGFKLTKFFSNCTDVLKAIPENDRQKSITDREIETNELPNQRVLGINWDPVADVLTFEQDLKAKPLTKRGLLSLLSSIYDPLGFVSPIVLPAKILFQKLASDGFGWDEYIGEQNENVFNDLINEITQLQGMSMPRCIRPNDYGNVVIIQLHHFSDASEFGYGCITYVRLIDDSQRIHCMIMFSKSRLCPMKRQSIPRLELQAALVASRINRFLLNAIDLSINQIYFWTDSTSVLFFLKNESRRFKPYVGNRVAEIMDNTSIEQWRYVQSKNNPADILSRGMKVDELNNSNWFRGPDFLYDHEDNWSKLAPRESTCDNCTVEFKQKCVDVDTCQTVNNTESTCMSDFIQYYSSWDKLIIATVWLLKYKYYLLKDHELSTKITVQDLRTAEKLLIVYIQKTEFTEFKQITANQCLSRSSKLKRLCPIIHNDMLCVGGRLSQAQWLHVWSRHQIILPKCHLSNLLIRHIHVVYGHVGVEHVLSLLRERFWILNAKVAIKKIINTCITCQRFNKPCSKQYMSDLPIERITPNLQPFQCVGIDYFGPICVKLRRARVKRYGCIFSCLNSRAIHLEISYDLSTRSFLQTFRRFSNRRGNPEVVYSDNGTNFVSSEKELRHEIRSWNQKQIDDDMKLKSIRWNFNPPGASHMGGVFERMIREVKRILRKLTVEQILTDEDLCTLMVEIEMIVNSRPLTPASTDSNDCNPLTPAHALFLKPPSVVTPGLVETENYPKRRYKQIQYLATIFWKRWTKQYLPLLQTRSKWYRVQSNFKVGDLVLIANVNCPRGKWPLARVMKIHEGRDGLVRSVTLRLGGGSQLVRPISKLVHLELN